MSLFAGANVPEKQRVYMQVPDAAPFIGTASEMKINMYKFSVRPHDLAGAPNIYYMRKFDLIEAFTLKLDVQQIDNVWYYNLYRYCARNDMNDKKFMFYSKRDIVDLLNNLKIN